MKLTEKFPDRVMINGEPYAIYTDYRRGIRHEQMLLYNPETTIGDLLYNWFPVIPNDLETALEAVNWFYRCGANEQEKQNSARKDKRLYDFDKDAEAISASFRQCYGICLHTCNLHWWEFSELLYGISAVRNAFSDRVQTRGMDTKGLKGKVLREVKEQQKRLELPKTATAKKRSKTLAERDAAMIAYVDRRFAEAESARKKKD
ncbi:MAG: bacteriophage Gp15 family protein [Clostridia bacterium]|nr:bacteriophage Gp15 family protein [Clostridia bacterium]